MPPSNPQANTNTIRLFLPGKAFSVWLFFAEDGQSSAWYGNLEAHFMPTPLGIDTRDYGLGIVASPSNWNFDFGTHAALA